MSISTVIAFVFSAIIIVQGSLFIVNRSNEAGKTAGILCILGGVLFIVATAMGLMNIADTLLMARWILYLVGLILVIVGAVKNKKSAKK